MHARKSHLSGESIDGSLALLQQRSGARHVVRLRATWPTCKLLFGALQRSLIV
jgi:hypothetical protein